MVKNKDYDYDYQMDQMEKVFFAATTIIFFLSSPHTVTLIYFMSHHQFILCPITSLLYVISATR
jgi:hypothetical protein